MADSLHHWHHPHTSPHPPHAQPGSDPPPDSARQKQRKPHPSAAKIARIIRLVWLLSERRRITIDDLCNRFRMSRRTAFRDLQAVRDAGLQVLYSPTDRTLRIALVDE